MAQKMHKGGIKPPAYPQVVTIDETDYVIRCRTCGMKWHITLSEYQIAEIQSGKPHKIKCSCGDVLKIV